MQAARTRTRTQARTNGWLTVARNAALVLIVLLAATGVALGDREALAFAGIVGIGVVLLWFGKQTIAAVVLGLFALNTAAWMVPGAVSNLRHGEQAVATLLPAAIAVAAVALVVGAAGMLATRGRPEAGRGAGRWIVLAAAAVMVVTVAGVAAGPSGGTYQRGTNLLEVETRDMAFAEERLVVDAGEVTVAVRNGDLFWHTFTVPDLGVDVRVPVRGERTATFEAPMGSYEFICAIPGHPQAGMRGTLIVR